MRPCIAQALTYAVVAVSYTAIATVVWTAFAANQFAKHRGWVE